ncbi:MAG: transporter substrate-binding domain-containing protein [Pseudomonadota bacterium]
MRVAYLIEPPFGFRDGSGALRGHDIELARLVLEAVDEPMEPVETTFAALLPGLAEGRWRMTTGLLATPPRKRAALFSRPVWTARDGLLVRRGQERLVGYAAAAADDRAVLAVVRDQAQHAAATRFGVPEDRIRVFDGYEAAAAAVRSREADAFASVAWAHEGFVARNTDWALEARTVPLAEGAPLFGAFAFARTDLALRDKVDGALASILGSDVHRAIAAAHGFPADEVAAVADAP